MATTPTPLPSREDAVKAHKASDREYMGEEGMRRVYWKGEGAPQHAGYFSRLYEVSKTETRLDFVKSCLGIDTHQKCAAFATRVHQCLDRKDNNWDFCKSETSLMEQCLRVHWAE
eukprot:PhF_6_TR739/c0_g1_i1/m.1177